MRLLTVERGTGYRMLKCQCGWREIVFTDTTLEAEGQRHLRDVHDMPAAGSSFAAWRRNRRGA